MSANPTPISYFEETLFPEHPFRLQMRFRKAPVHEFFGPSEAREQLLQERKKWLEQSPEKTALILPEGEPLLRRAIAEVFLPDGLSGIQTNGTDLDLLKQTSSVVEPDFLLLQTGKESDVHTVVAGAVCFPSSWPLEEKIGQTMEFTHGPVPGLNEKLGDQITRFLQKIPPGISWERTNWGLSRSSELNQHPGRKLPRLTGDIKPDEVWMRIEWQSLVSLPPSGVLFGIRVFVYPLSEVMLRPRWRAGLKQDLETMPEEMLKYKGLWNARPKLLGFLA